jgi:uncharacterized protein YxeA
LQGVIAMKNKKICLIVAIVFVLIAALAIWYFVPTTFLSKVNSSDIKSISVFDGNTGERFVFSDTDEIRYVVENIQSTKMKKDTLSIGYLGFSFRISFFDENGKEIESFTINSSNTIRKDPFFYRCDGDLCFDYLKELEEKYSN